jgi:hypothetical protein
MPVVARIPQLRAMASARESIRRDHADAEYSDGTPPAWWKELRPLHPSHKVSVVFGGEHEELAYRSVKRASFGIGELEVRFLGRTTAVTLGKFSKVIRQTIADCILNSSDVFVACW